MEIKEKNFPRGGKKPALFKSKKSFSLFRKPKTKIKKKGKKNKQESNEELQVNTKPFKDGFKVKHVDDLKPSVVQDGMLILGIISQITEKIVNVSLPGGIRGVITLNSVSEFYNSMIENSSEVPSLNEIFKPGDVLPVKVLSVSENHSSLMLTSDPKLINQKLSYSLIEPGFVLVGSVKSKEDHGFIIDFGIEHVNSFLSYENVDNRENIIVGQLVRCCVIQCNTSGGSCSAQVSMCKKDLQSSVIKKSSSLPLYSFIPGFQFEVTVTKKFHDGVEVSYKKGDPYKGYIHEDHLLKKFPNLEGIDIGSDYVASLLYVKPLVNFLYFKIMPKKPIEWPFNYGQIVSGKVMRVRKSGVMFKIIQGSNKAKCFVPLSKLKNGEKITQDQTDLASLYPINKKVSKIRLGQVNYMNRYYLGATDKASLTEKYFSVSDLKCGEIVMCKILSFGKSQIRLEIGKTVSGVVGFTDMSDVPQSNPISKYKIGQKVKARVLEIVPETRFVRLTMKPTLLKEKEILSDIETCKKNKVYVGTIFKILPSKLLVKFFNGITGMIPKHHTPYPDSNSLEDHFHVGELVKCSPISIQQNSLTLSMLLNEADSCSQLEVGKKYSVVVVNSTDSGLFVDVTVDDNIKCKGFLPAVLLSAHISLASALHSTYSEGEELTVYCVSKDTNNEPAIFGLEKVFRDFYEGKPKEELEKLFTDNSIIPLIFKYKNNKTDNLVLQSIIPREKGLIVKTMRNDFDYSFTKYQLVYGKILRVGDRSSFVSIKVNDVWDKDFHTSLDFLDSYLQDMSYLVSRQKTKLNAYNGNISPGCSVKGVIEEVRTSHAMLRTEDDDLAIVEGKFKKGEKITGKVIWIDGPEQLIYAIPEVQATEENHSKKLPLVPENDNVRGKILFINGELVVLELKGRGRGNLAYLPLRRHLNDLTNNECVYVVGDELKVWVTRKNSNYLLAMDSRVVWLQEKSIWKKSTDKLKESVQNLKRKLQSEKLETTKKRRSDSESEDVQVISEKLNSVNKNANGVSETEELPEVKEEIDFDEDEFNCTGSTAPRLEYDDVEIKTEVDEDEDEEQSRISVMRNEEKIPLSSSSESEDEEETSNKKMEESKAFKVGFNWEVLNNNSLLSGVMLKNDEPSSDDEDDESKYDKKKRRRLTAIEKKEKAKSEEERLRAIEERLMDTEREPETADDFDRAVLSSPDSSALWLKYMAFHVQGTEIEKARAVAKRALKSISFREEQEKLNIWIALLNLENMYGNEDSLNKTLTEALQLNDPYKIHLHMLKLHGQSTKFQEMERLGAFMMKKYKDMENMWYDVGAAFFSVGKVESARNVLQKALTVLEKKQHVSLISKFAQLENKYGTPERAQTLYESILASFPKRVDIWSCYVDMLAKSNQIDLARQVLERATSQSLRPRKMKTLFKKFLAFEEAHGSPETVEKVREAAVEYVQTFGGED